MPNITQKILTEDFYSTTITELDWILTTWDISFNVATPPVNTKGWIIADPSVPWSLEKMYYDNVIWNRIYVKWINRINPKTHLQGAVVQINDLSNIFNYYAEISSTTFFCEKTWNLQVNVFWWPTLVDWNPTNVADTLLTMTDNSVNYIYYKPSTNEIKSNIPTASITVDSWVILSEITCASGFITSINYRNYKFNFTTSAVNSWNSIWSITTSDVALTAWDYWYFANWLVTLNFTLPTTASVWTRIQIVAHNLRWWKIIQNAWQVVYVWATQTTLGSSGYLQSTEVWDSIELICVEADTTWREVDMQWNIIII